MPGATIEASSDVLIEKVRTATRWEAEGPLVRLHIGLEDPDDLIEDLAAGLARYGAA